MNSALESPDPDEWATPYDLFQQLHAEFWFTLDAAATAENAKTPAYLSAELDALTLAWSGTVWLNPPYSQCRRFIAKASEEAARGCIGLPCAESHRYSVVARVRVGFGTPRATARGRGAFPAWPVEVQ